MKARGIGRSWFGGERRLLGKSFCFTLFFFFDLLGFICFFVGEGLVLIYGGLVCRCGAVDCDGVSGGNATGWYLVCEYYPPGNVEGQFAQEVGKVKYQIVGGSGDAVKVANRLVNSAQRRWTGMSRWSWTIMLGFVVMGLAF